MYKLRTAAPGVRVVSVETNEYKTNVIDVSMAVPLDENAAANTLLIRLMKRSSKQYADFTLLNRKLDELYGAYLGASVSKDGDAQILTLSICCLDDRFALDNESIAYSCAELLADLIFNPNETNGDFGEDKLNLEKRLLISEILEELDDKRSYALKQCTSYMCKDEPFGRSVRGTAEEVENVTIQDIYAAWKRILSTAVFQITVVSGNDVNKIVDLFAERFGRVERQPRNISTLFIKECKEVRRYSELQPVNQGKLVIGYRAGTEYEDDNYYAIRVMTDIFGGGTYSKLFANVREKMSLAYYCSARFNNSKGVIMVQSGINTDKEETVTAEIENQLNDVRNGNFDDEILESSKRSLVEALTFNSPNVISNWYSRQILSEKIVTPEDDKSGILAVTKEQVCEAARNVTKDTIFMLASDGTQEDENED